jgi:hypothetical protein
MYILVATWMNRKAREEAAKDIVMGLSEGLSGLDGEKMHTHSP